MNLLITLCLRKQNILPLAEIPPELLSPAETTITDFIFAYNAKFKKPPSPERVNRKFPFFIPTTVKDIDSFVLEDVAEQVKYSKLTHQWEHTLQNILTVIREGGTEDLPVGDLSELLRLTAMSSGVTTFSTYDREGYFRIGNLQLGMKIIDTATGGIGNGEVLVIAGRLGNKKTTVSLFVAHSWWKAGKKVLFASNEMAPGDIFSRLDGIVGRFNPLVIRGEPTTETRSLVERTGSLVRVATGEHGGQIFIPVAKLRTPAQVFALAQHLGVDAIIIDGIYLMTPNDGRISGAKWERVSEISNQIKQGAQDSMLPVVALTQLKRTGGKKDMYDPEDLAFSDSIGQDADFVLALNPSTLDKNKLEAQLVKNRFGKEISTILTIDFDKMTMVEDSALDEETPSEEWFAKPSGEGGWIE